MLTAWDSTTFADIPTPRKWTLTLKKDAIKQLLSMNKFCQYKIQNETCELALFNIVIFKH